MLVCGIQTWYFRMGRIIVCLFVLISVVAGRNWQGYRSSPRYDYSPYPCPFGFFQLPGQRNCYRFSTERDTWYGALKKCKAMQGFLVEIESKHESYAITKYLLKTLPPKLQEGDHDIWIGLSDRKREGYFRWEETGVLVSKPGNKDVNFNFWAPDDPNASGPVPGNDVDCARLINEHPQPKFVWSWADWKCSDKYYYLCEYDKRAPYHRRGPDPYA